MQRPLSLVAATLIVLAPALAHAQAKVDRAAVAKQIEANERAVMTAVAKADVASFTKLVATDAMGIDGTGVAPVSEFVKILPQVKVETWAIDNVKVTWVNDTTAIITYRWTGKGMVAGQPFPSPTWASTVWANRGGTWAAVFHQETDAVPPPPPAKKKQ